MTDTQSSREIRELAESLRRLERRVHTIERKQMSTQSEVDALTTAVGQVSKDLATAQTTLQEEIDNLAKANPALDLTALQAAVAPVDAAVVALEGLKPTPAA